MTNPEDLPDDIDALKAIVLRQQDQNARLEKLVAGFKRALFGVKSEKVDPGQYELAFEDIETAIETIHAERDADVALRPGKADACITLLGSRDTHVTNRQLWYGLLPFCGTIQGAFFLLCVGHIALQLHSYIVI